MKQVGKLGAWVCLAGIIVIYPSVRARREREAKALVERLGGRCHVPLDSTANYLPSWMVTLIGFENLCPVEGISLANSDVCDDDIEVLLHLTNLQRINLCGCHRVTPSCLARLRQLPQMKLVWVDGISIEEAGRHLTGETMAAGH